MRQTYNLKIKALEMKSLLSDIIEILTEDEKLKQWVKKKMQLFANVFFFCCIIFCRAKKLVVKTGIIAWRLSWRRQCYLPLRSWLVSSRHFSALSWNAFVVFFLTFRHLWKVLQDQRSVDPSKVWRDWILELSHDRLYVMVILLGKVFM